MALPCNWIMGQRFHVCIFNKPVHLPPQIGIPSVVIYGDKHELEIVKFAHRKKAIINFGYGPYLSKKLITKKLESVLRDYNLRKLLNTNSKKIVDGKGVDRVVQLISKNYELVN